MIKYYNFIFTHYGIKECIKSIKSEKRKILKLFVVGYVLFNDELKKWIKENIIDIMEKDALIKTGAEGYIFELVEHARYKNEKNETGKKRMLIKG